MKINKVMTAEEWVKSFAAHAYAVRNPPDDRDYMIPTLAWTVVVCPPVGPSKHFSANTESKCWEMAAKWVASL